MYQYGENGLSMPSYDEIAHILDLFQPGASAAELHGLMTALLCSGHLVDGENLVTPLLGQQSLDEFDRNTLLQLYLVTSELLQNFEFDFQLLLPDDQEPLSQRAQAMSEWCQGFMTGLKQMEIEPEDACSHDSREALLRFLEIAVLDYDRICVSEEDEKAFFEVGEYVRLSVLMIYSEFSSSADSTFFEADKVYH